MARYLLETSATDGYLLEDGSGVLLKDETTAPVLVQQKGGYVNGGTTLTVTLDAPVTVGNCLVAVFWNAYGAPSGITGGGTWVAGGTFTKYDKDHGIWVSPSCSSADTNIVLTFTDGLGEATVMEWANLAASPLDVASNAGSSGTAVSVANQPTAAVNLVVAMASNTSGQGISAGPSGGFTALTENTGGGWHLEGAYLIQSSAALATCGWTWAGTAYWDAAALSLKGATTSAPVASLPGSASLALTGATPTVIALAPRASVPGAASLTLAGAVPAVVAVAPAASLPGSASMTLSGATPTVTAVGTAVRVPGAASLTLSGATPAVTAIGTAVRVPGAASLALAGATPAVLTPQVAAPSGASLVLTGAVPNVAAGAGTSVYYMAPTGNDTDVGSIGSPRRNLLAASALLAPGDTLYVRGGTYSDPGGYNWSATASGTAGQPILVKAYPSETPIFNGGGTIEQALIVNNVDYVTFEDLAFTDFFPYDNGIILVVSSGHITLRRVHSYGSAGNGPGASTSDHHLYPVGVNDLLIDDCTFDGMPGAAVHIYGGASTAITVQNSHLTNNGIGIIAGQLAGGSFTGNTITSTGEGIHFNNTTSSVDVNGNEITAPVGIWSESLASYGPATEDYSTIHSANPFKVGWPGDPYTLAAWQATGRGAHDVTGASVASLPGSASLALTTAVPAVTAVGAALRVPAAASLVFTGATPVVTAIGTALRLPTAASLIVTGATPAVVAGGTQARVPSAASLALTGSVPTVTTTTGLVVAPSAASLAMTAFAPDMVLTDNWSFAPGAAALTLAMFAPSVVATSSVLAGRTLDQHGDPIASCTVDAFVSATNDYVGTAVSDGQGRYSITVLPGVPYFLVAYKGDEVFGASARDLVA